MEHPKSEDFITSFPNTGTNLVEKPRYDEATHRVWINDVQYFDGVEKTVWEFYIGGYQPAQKWLKDRRGRTLTYDDIAHWMKNVVALEATGRLMGEIDG